MDNKTQRRNDDVGDNNYVVGIEEKHMYVEYIYLDNLKRYWTSPKETCLYAVYFILKRVKKMCMLLFSSNREQWWDYSVLSSLRQWFYNCVKICEWEKKREIEKNVSIRYKCVRQTNRNRFISHTVNEWINWHTHSQTHARSLASANIRVTIAQRNQANNGNKLQSICFLCSSAVCTLARLWRCGDNLKFIRNYLYASH